MLDLRLTARCSGCDHDARQMLESPPAQARDEMSDVESRTGLHVAAVDIVRAARAHDEVDDSGERRQVGAIEQLGRESQEDEASECGQAAEKAEEGVDDLDELRGKIESEVADAFEDARAQIDGMEEAGDAVGRLEKDFGIQCALDGSVEDAADVQEAIEVRASGTPLPVARPFKGLEVGSKGNNEEEKLVWQRFEPFRRPCLVVATCPPTHRPGTNRTG
jgi:hypothetical protein